MKRVLVSVLAGVAVFAIAFASKAAGDDAIDIAITVSPKVINIQSASTVVTVHTDIPYSAVAGASVTLNGIEIAWWKSDDRGYFVAKFVAAEVKAIDGIDTMDTITLTLEGLRVDGVPFSGTDIVDVINVKAKK